MRFRQTTLPPSYQDRLLASIKKADSNTLKNILNEHAQDIYLNQDGVMHLAAGTGRCDILAILIEHGADINQLSPETSETPLNFIIKMRDTPYQAIYTMLMRHLPDIELENFQEKTPLFTLLQSDHPEKHEDRILDLLYRGAAWETQRVRRHYQALESNPVPKHDLMSLISVGHGLKHIVASFFYPYTKPIKKVSVAPETIQFPGYSIYHSIEQLGLGYTLFALHIAQGQLNEAQQFLASENDTYLINYPDRLGHTPLIRAVVNEQVASIRWLLEAGAQINQEDHQGHSALYYACLKCLYSSQIDRQANYLSIAHLLLEYGAEINDAMYRLLPFDQEQILSDFFPREFVLK